jgi:hypothetical protein
MKTTHEEEQGVQEEDCGGKEDYIHPHGCTMMSCRGGVHKLWELMTLASPADASRLQHRVNLTMNLASTHEKEHPFWSNRKGTKM